MKRDFLKLFYEYKSQRGFIVWLKDVTAI